MQVTLITGGSRGIGEALVRAHTARGDQVVFTYLSSEDRAKALAVQTGAMAFRCDTRQEAEALLLAAQVQRLYRRVDTLICNAGTAHTGLLQDMALTEWEDLFAVHVRGAFLMARAFLPGMIARGSGNILLMSSMWGQVGASCEVAYSACKAALIGMGKALAKEVAPSGIRVNCLAPGAIDTDMLSAYSQEAKQALADQTPLQRLGTAEDVAQAALFLSSPAASFITGQVLGVNGGMVMGN